MKTKEELNALKEEVENLGKKLAVLSEEELAQISGGVIQTGAPEKYLATHGCFQYRNNALKIKGQTQTEFFFVIDQLQAEDDGKYVTNK